MASSRTARHARPGLTAAIGLAGIVLAFAASSLMGVSPAEAGRPNVAQATTTEATAPTASVEGVGPQLRIDIDDGRTSTAPGDTLDYTITVVNLGTEGLTELGISQSLPPGLQFGSADADGTADADGVHWTVDLAPDETATLHSTMTLSETPPDLLRLATVACATEAEATSPVVCATHSDELPAGAAAAAADASTTGAAPAEEASGSSIPVVPIGVAAVLVVAAVAAAAVVVARRRSPA